MTSHVDAEYDVIVIGGGPAGENAAAFAIAGSSRTAAIVEHELFGGECSYWACIPSKALLRPGAVLAEAKAMPGVDATGLDLAAVLARRDRFVHNHDDENQVEWVESAGITPIRGSARLTGERTVAVTQPDGTTTTLRARQAVVIATGTTATLDAPVPGLREALPWTSRDATNLKTVPPRVAILGGGVVACEAATWLTELGAHVTLIVRGERLLPRAEPFASEWVLNGLSKAGVDVRLHTKPAAISRINPQDNGIGDLHGGKVTLTLSKGEPVEVDELVVAIGRSPATTSLGLETVNLTPGEYIDVDDQLTVKGVEGDWLYAVGDVNNRAPLTHMGKYQARVAGDVIAARAEGRPLDAPRYVASADHQHVPQVVYTNPEVAWVGLTEDEAREAGHAVETVEVDIAVAGSALSRKGFHGRAKLVIDAATDRLLGATFVGPETGEQLHAATIAIVGQVPLETLWHAIPAFPTVSEFWLRLLEARREKSETT
ncbi:dihydrolipoyl dehydrogenase family protein [Nocardia camponoti]|uniref:Oxidoreductase n=1 Tax=Nocardia camponoti TaxID=1616106 RepID=A0A917QGJ0_9NOCA|nr:NAD(P)/FAD-dependent oxidoreductase [Nocardia camponoti]GGK49569.1 oxidoreductase [Nocardia camponoti]